LSIAVFLALPVCVEAGVQFVDAILHGRTGQI
jgi:hypothetical protein